jgi:D-arabinose 1-dehydrogenase-like Zn-dependent alcohol dehydrogenase
LSGRESLCPFQSNTGYSRDGGFAEYMVGAANHLSKIPDGLSFEQASPILCAGVTVYAGLKNTEAKPGQWVTISTSPTLTPLSLLLTNNRRPHLLTTPSLAHPCLTHLYIHSYKCEPSLMHDENVRFAVGAGGGLGHLAVQYAAAMGMRVVAVDMPDKRDFCLSLGAELVFDATDKGLVDDVSTSTRPSYLDVHIY